MVFGEWRHSSHNPKFLAVPQTNHFRASEDGSQDSAIPKPLRWRQWGAISRTIRTLYPPWALNVSFPPTLKHRAEGGVSRGLGQSQVFAQSLISFLLPSQSHGLQGPVSPECMLSWSQALFPGQGPRCAQRVTLVCWTSNL